MQHSTDATVSDLERESRFAKRARLDASPELFSDADDLVSTQEPLCDSESAVIAMNSDLSSDADVVFPSDSEDCASSAVFPSDNSVGSDARSIESDLTVSTQDETVAPRTSLGRGVSEESKRQEELDYVGGILVANCCRKDCLLHLTAHDVLTLQRKFSSLGANAQRQWLGDRIQENSRPSLETGILNTRYIVGGQEVCQLAWCAVLRISPKRVSRVTKSISLGMVTSEHGNKGKKRMNTKSESAKVWMSRYFHLVGDHMPHSNQLHLPSWETQKDVYSRFMDDMKLQGITENDIVSLSQFYKIWSSDFQNVVIPEVRHARY